MTARRRASQIVIDRSPSSQVVYCTACSGWSEVVTSQTAAYRVAVDHEIDCHPGNFGLRDSTYAAARRQSDS